MKISILNIIITRMPYATEAAWFDAEHARWAEEHGKIMHHLRAALEQQQDDAQLRQLVDAATACWRS
jgi:hypothetical protein